MSLSIYRVRCEHVITLDTSTKEVDAIVYGDIITPVDNSQEYFISADFFSNEGDTESRDEFAKQVRPEVFVALKKLAEAGDGFVVA